MDETGAKITELAELTDVASDDLLVVVDKSDTSMADSGTDKKVQKSNLLKGLTVSNLASGVLDTDLSSVSGNHDTLASAKAIKAYSDAGKAGGSYCGFVASDQTTTSTTGVQVGSAQVTLTTKGGAICIEGSAVLSNNTNTSRLAFDIDGTVYTPNSLTSSSTGEKVNAVYYKSGLSAGSHTVKLLYYTQAGGTAKLHAFNSFTLLVWEL